MTVRIATLFIYLFVHLFTVLSLAETAEKTAQSWKLDGREVPIPLGSRESLQNSLRGIDQPNVAARIKQAPRNRQQWNQMISERADARNTPLDQVEKMMSVKIEQTALSGVNVYCVTPAKDSK